MSGDVRAADVTIAEALLAEQAPNQSIVAACRGLGVPVLKSGWQLLSPIPL